MSNTEIVKKNTEQFKLTRNSLKHKKELAQTHFTAFELAPFHSVFLTSF